MTKDPEHNRKKVYDLLKENGYYDLTIKTLIKYIADKNGAHLDTRKSHWIGMTNHAAKIELSAISVVATHMIYAATKQIKGLHDYYDVPPLMEFFDDEYTNDVI